MSRVAIAAICISIAVGIGAFASLLSGRSGVYGLSSVSSAASSTVTPGSADSLYALEVATLTRKGISPARARQAIAVQAAIAKAHLVGKIEAAMGDRYAGAWFEPEAARLHIGVTSPASRRIAAGVIARAGLAANVLETPVRSTWAQLANTQKQWNRRLAKLFALEEAQAGLVPQSNAISITLSSSVSPRERAALKHKASNGSANVNIDVVSSSRLTITREIMTAKCNAFKTKEAYCNKTLTSGVTIEDGSGEPCTAGPMAIPKSSKSETYLLTAGHCLVNPGGIGSKQYAFNRSKESKEIGPTVEFVKNTKGDVGAVLITKSSYWVQTTKAPILAETTEWSVKDPESSYTVEGERAPVVGNMNCHEGQTTGQSCGIITKIYMVGTGSNLEGLVEDEQVKSATGDSGGPWLFIQTNKSDKSVLMEGTHVGKNTLTGMSVYEPLSRAFSLLSKLNLELLTKGNEERP